MANAADAGFIERNNDASTQRDAQTPVQDIEHILIFQNQTAVVSPFGASLRRYSITSQKSEWDVIWGYHLGANKKGGQGDVLVPFPGRIKGGTFKFEGKIFELEKNDKDGPNAIHGFLRATLYKTENISTSSAAYSFEILSTEFARKGFPFSLRVEVSYALSVAGLTTSYRIKNIGDNDAPAGIGFHPYFRADRGTLEDWKVKIPALDYIELENIVPTGRILKVQDTKLDFRNSRLIGNESFNDCLAHLERDGQGNAHLQIRYLDSLNSVNLTLDKSFDFVVIYTGDQIAAPHQRQGFAIEPTTCAPDAFNREGWGARVLKPGAEMTGNYSVKAQAHSV